MANIVIDREIFEAVVRVLRAEQQLDGFPFVAFDGAKALADYLEAAITVPGSDNSRDAAAERVKCKRAARRAMREALMWASPCGHPDEGDGEDRRKNGGDNA